MTNEQMIEQILINQFKPLIIDGQIDAYYQGFNGEFHFYRAVNDKTGYSFTLEEFPTICPDTQLNIKG